MQSIERFDDLDELHADCDALGSHPAGWNRRAWAMRDVQGLHSGSVPVRRDAAGQEPIPFRD